MSDTYLGDSPAKKLARLSFWRAVRAGLSKPFRESTFFVLASREGGDVSVLLGLGAAAHQIVAVDREAEAVAAFRKKWPSVRCELGEADAVADVLRPDVAFLDFCSPVGAGVLATAGRVAGRVRLGGLFGVAVLKGRENAVLIEAKPSRSERRALAAQRRKKVFCSGSTRRLLGELKASGYDEKTARDAWLERELNPNAMNAYGGIGADPTFNRVLTISSAIGAQNPSRWFQPARSWSYKSTTNSSAGSPMVAALYNVRRGDLSVMIDYGDPVHEDVKADDAAVRNAALALGPDAALLLNLPPATLAAWRAHATRGTYERPSS
ncbi:MAG TPA: hypothetical protein VGQ38_15290 [Gaiellaceae bacterium]|nr:hypothetical protein [Gaiellaceae bacterium]